FLVWAQLAATAIAFLWILLATWIMSRIERRPVGAYGLPLVRSALPRFLCGYLLWGFLPITVALVLLRWCGVFSFGTIALHGTQILYWAGVWGLVFLAVGLFEDFAFRGYALQTLADGIGFWPAAVVLAALFGAVHMSNTGETRIGLAGAALFGLFAA